MRTKGSLRVGIVGCGKISQWGHIPVLKRIKNVELVAACDEDEDSATSVAKRYHISRYYTGFSQMLEKEELDMVDVCTPPKTHAALSIQAMKAGCHVLVEKPMAISTQEADKMVRACKDYRVKLGVVHNLLFAPVAIKAKTMVSEGTIGDLTGIDIKYSLSKYEDEVMNRDHWSHKLLGSTFGNKLPHSIYLAMAFLGNLEPVAVHAMKLSSYEWMAADELRVILRGEKGLGTITSSQNWPKNTVMLDIFGTKMNLHIYFSNAVLTTYGPGGHDLLSKGSENVRQGLQLLASTTSRVLSIALRRYHNSHHTLIRKFIESVRNDTELPVTAEEGREVIRVCEKIVSQIGSGLQKTKSTPNS